MHTCGMSSARRLWEFALATSIINRYRHMHAFPVGRIAAREGMPLSAEASEQRGCWTLGARGR